MSNFYPAAPSEITVKMKFLKNVLPLEKYLMGIKYPPNSPSPAPTSGAWCRLSAAAWVPSPEGSHGNLLQLEPFSLIQYQDGREEEEEELYM